MQRRRSRYEIMQALRIPFELKDALLAKKLKKPLYDQTIEMVCQGKRHKIQLRFPGRITLLNHGSKSGEELLIKLGGDKPTCIRFLEEWKRNPHGVASSRPLVRKLQMAKEDMTNKRRTALAEQDSDYLERSILNRLESRIQAILNNLRYRLDKQFLTTAEKAEIERSYRYSYNRRPEEKDERIIVPTIKFVKYEDRLNNPLTKKEELKENEDSY